MMNLDDVQRKIERVAKCLDNEINWTRTLAEDLYQANEGLVTYARKVAAERLVAADLSRMVDRDSITINNLRLANECLRSEKESLEKVVKTKTLNEKALTERVETALSKLRNRQSTTRELNALLDSQAAKIQGLKKEIETLMEEVTRLGNKWEHPTLNDAARTMQEVLREIPHGQETSMADCRFCKTWTKYYKFIERVEKDLAVAAKRDKERGQDAQFS